VQQIGRYRVESEVGRGAMGVVYLAHDPRVRRRLALKTYRIPEGLPPERQKEFQERFLREAQTAGSLDHPAIVTIYDAGEDPVSGVPFIAMEYVQGRNLHDLLGTCGPLPLSQACSLADTVAAGLHAAHSAGIIHRDIKPANILIREGDGAVKLADFGVARPPTSELTSAGQSLGSPAYMSPEQIRGGRVDGRSDLFSLAVVLYEALTGRRPFVGEDLASLGYAVVHTTPLPVTRCGQDLPTALDGFFTRALAKTPEARFQDGDSFRRALSEALACPAAGTDTLAATGLLEPVTDSAPTDDSPARAAARANEAAVEAVRASGAAMLALLPLLRRGAAILARGAVLSGRHVTRLGAAGRQVSGRMSFRQRGVMAAVALGLLMAGMTALWFMQPSSSMTLQVKNSFTSGTLTVMVDGNTIYAGSLEARRRQVKAFGRKWGPEWGNQEFSQSLDVSPGQHEIRVRVEPGDGPPLEQTLSGEFQSGESRKLKLTMGGRHGDPLNVRLN
jgi:tRNA A-37 threonylcarbamoyl transferase component Bud32